MIAISAASPIRRDWTNASGKSSAETSLGTSDETRRRLLDALLAEALAPVEEIELEAAE